MTRVMEPIPLVDLGAQDRTIRPQVRDALDRVLDSGRFILGPEVERFEQQFAEYVGVPASVGVGSGTAALELALRACGVGAGDEVVTVSHTFAATVEAILHVGARPVLVDIDAATFNMDPAAITPALTDRTRAVLPVHLYGRPAPMPEIEAICRSRNIRIIEDAAQAHGAAIGERRCGSFGDLACFSFYPGKNLGAYGDAGAVCGFDEELLERVRKLRNHGRSEKYVHEEAGWCERLDEMQAAVLNVKLQMLDEWTASRRRNAAHYRTLLADLNGVTVPDETAEIVHAYHLFVIRVPNRDRVAEQLASAGISTGVHYPLPIHRQPGFGSDCRISGSMVETERAAGEILSLPLYPELEFSQIEYVVEHLQAALATDV